MSQIKRAIAAVVLLLMPSLPTAQTAQAPKPPALQPIVGPISAPAMTVADYNRALSLQAKFEGKVVDAIETPTWMESGKFWYRKSVKGGNVFVVVDPQTLEKKPAFDHAKIAAALSSASGKTYSAAALPFTAFTFADGDKTLNARVDDANWKCTFTDNVCAKSTVPQPNPGAGVGGRGGRGGSANANGAPGTSPDGKRAAFIRSGNIWVRNNMGAADDGAAVTKSGTAEHPFTMGNIVWSPDSKKIAASRVTEQGDRRMVRYVESSPADQVQPKTFERQYTKPGDALDQQERVLVDVDAKREVKVDPALFANPYSLSRQEWRKDSRAFTFEYNQRGHQAYRVIEVNGTTGAARALVDETAETFIHYNRAALDLTAAGRTYRYDVNDGAEIIWMSERDGWGHLYLYDGATGRVKNQITKGAWPVRAVVRVDEAAREIIFASGGMDPKMDPYFAQYYRIKFDGTGLTPLTNADGNHTATFSSDYKYYVDTWSRIDMAPAAQLRRTSDAKILLDLERGDIAPLTAAGWRAPESFVAKGRDGTTDIYGIIVRPTTFNPAKKYPVIENIYAGPHGSFVPKSFTSYYGMQALAELGFVVVQIDGMGTANRSRAFHDVAWKNLADAGFPDRIAWHKAVAKKYPFYDITRVGIYGGSAGGQNSLGGMLLHSDFYKVAVSFAGCHDNRMDKIWWNEQWMGWPIGPQYAASSNVTHASKLQGKLLLVFGELDTNVDPSSTMQVVNALIKANKQFDLLVMPGEDHPAGRRGPSAPYGDRKLWDFFVTNLIGAKTPNWNAVTLASSKDGSIATADSGPASLWVQTWDQVAAAWKDR